MWYLLMVEQIIYKHVFSNCEPAVGLSDYSVFLKGREI